MTRVNIGSEEGRGDEVREPFSLVRSNQDGTDGTDGTDGWNRCFVIRLTLFTSPFASESSVLAAFVLAFAVEGGAIPLEWPLFPPNNWWNTDISNAPVDASSATIITWIGPNRGLHPDFGGDAGGGDVYGFPFAVVDSSQPKLTVDFSSWGWPDESDGVDHNNGNVSFPFYPVPSECITQNGWVEGGQPGSVDQHTTGDRHILMVDKTNNALYELYNVWYDGTKWRAASGAYWNMNTNNRRTDGWTSADAAGLQILPGLVRYDEAFGDGEIRHAFRFTLSSAAGYVFPASHRTSIPNGDTPPPYGLRLRLKPTTNISSYPAYVQKIFRAMMKYGLILADQGSNMYISGTYDTRWDNGVLNPAFGALKASDFEVIERGWKPSYSYIIAFPSSSAGNGDTTSATVTVYDANNNVATGYTGTIHFTSTDGAATLPVNYTFLGADAGVHTFTNGFTFRTTGVQVVTGTDTVVNTVTNSRGITVGPPTPTGLTATADTTTHVSVSWLASQGAVSYELVRISAAGQQTIPLAATSYGDTVTAGGAYIYKVRAIDSSSRYSGYSAPDIAMARTFTDDPLIANTTAVKAIHITELRDAINALRQAAGIGTTTFSDPSPSAMSIRKTHLDELRAALTAARAAAGLTNAAYTDPTITAQSTKVRAAHVQELRDRLK